MDRQICSDYYEMFELSRVNCKRNNKNNPKLKSVLLFLTKIKQNACPVSTVLFSD